MESFPSKAVRAFDKPCNFIYAPETGSFCINGEVNGLRACVVCGVAATEEDMSRALVLSGSAAEIAGIVTNEHKVNKLLKQESVTNFVPCFSQSLPDDAKFYDEYGDLLASGNPVGDFILDHAKEVQPFASRDKSGARPQLTRASVSLSVEQFNSDSLINIDMVTTDGHRMQVIGTSILDDECGVGLNDYSFDIPISILAALKLSSCLHFAAYGHTANLTCFSDEYGIVTISWEQSSDFPPWRTVIPDESEMISVPHCIPAWGAIDRTQRKEGCDLYLLGIPPWYLHSNINAFAIVEDSTIIGVGGEETALSDTTPFVVVKAKYGWEVGKLARKVKEEDLSLLITENEDNLIDKPIRIDWAVEDVHYTHLLMPKRVTGADADWDMLVADLE